jgi:hypothetical protein
MSRAGEMQPIAFFVFQFLWFTLAWALIAAYVVWPWSKTLALHQRLSLWVAPEMFRVLGLGLLVPNLSPEMPLSFALPTAIADTVTSLLAVLAFIALQRSWQAARLLVWLCTIVGVSDLLVAFPHAASTGAIAHLHTQWYVPVFAGPVMVVAHAACIATLLGSRRPGPRG